MRAAKPIRSLVRVLGDQLDPAAAAFDDFEPKRAVVWMAEVAAESVVDKRRPYTQLQRAA